MAVIRPVEFNIFITKDSLVLLKRGRNWVGPDMVYEDERGVPLGLDGHWLEGDLFDTEILPPAMATIVVKAIQTLGEVAAV